MSFQCRGLLVVVCSVALICLPLPVEAASYLRARGHELSTHGRLWENEDATFRVPAPSPVVLAPAPVSAAAPAPSLQAPAPQSFSWQLVVPVISAPAPAPAVVTVASTMSKAHMKGETKLEVADQSQFQVGDYITIGGQETKKIIGISSLIIDSPLMNDYPATTVIQKIATPMAAGVAAPAAVVTPPVAVPPAAVVTPALPPAAPPPVVSAAAPPAMAPAVPPPPPPITPWPAIAATPMPTNQPLLAGSLCATADSCSRCTALPECGWCAMEMKCVEGTKLGPRTEQCMVYDFMTCSNIACDQRNTCSDCLTDHGCGWCAANARCAGGDGAGPFTASTCPAPKGFKNGRPVWAHAFAATKCEDTPALHSSELWDNLRGMMYKSRARIARMDAQIAAAAAAVPPPQPMPPMAPAAPCPTTPPTNQVGMPMPLQIPVVGGAQGVPPSISMPGYPGMVWSLQSPEKVPTTTVAPETTPPPTTTAVSATLPTTTMSTTPCPTPAPTTPAPPTTPPPPLAPPVAPEQKTPIEVHVDINQHVDTKANAHQVHSEVSEKTISRDEAASTHTMQAPAAAIAMSPAFLYPAPAPSPVGHPVATDVASSATAALGSAATIPPVAGATIPPIDTSGATVPPIDVSKVTVPPVDVSDVTIAPIEGTTTKAESEY